jgi:hypothetical protein
VISTVSDAAGRVRFATPGLALADIGIAMAFPEPTLRWRPPTLHSPAMICGAWWTFATWVGA